VYWISHHHYLRAYINLIYFTRSRIPGALVITTIVVLSISVGIVIIIILVSSPQADSIDFGLVVFASVAVVSTGIAIDLPTFTVVVIINWFRSRQNVSLRALTTSRDHRVAVRAENNVSFG